MRVLFKAENACFKNKKKHQRVFYFELLPSVTYRHVAWELGHEYNLYLSWMVWAVSITLIRAGEI